MREEYNQRIDLNAIKRTKCVRETFSQVKDYYEVSVN